MMVPFAFRFPAIEVEPKPNTRLRALDIAEGWMKLTDSLAAISKFVNAIGDKECYSFKDNTLKRVG